VNEALYYIQDTRQITGNCVMWWAKDGHGYTCDLDLAWKVTKEKADAICRDRKTDIAHAAHKIDRLAGRHLDFQKLPMKDRRRR
jgi:hypothetical protein